MPSKPFAVILCNFNDIPALSLPESFFTNVISPGPGSLFDYWQKMSYGAMDLSGSKLFGPWTMQYSYFVNSTQGRDAWISEAKRLAGINGVDLSPFYGVIAVINGNADDSRSGNDVACGVCWEWSYSNWHWCQKCQALFKFPSLVVGPCPGGGQHDLTASSDYGLMPTAPGVPGQNQWGMCGQCNGIYYTGNPTPGWCPSGGVHISDGSSDFTIGFGTVGYRGQNGWRWCSKCQMLVYSGSTAKCAGRGNHDISQSSDYTLFSNANNFNLSFLGHETGHTLNLDHSFDTNSAPWDPIDDGRPGAYGDSLDIMSNGIFGGLPATFNCNLGSGPCGPGLNAPNREGLGWLPESRIYKVDHKAGENWSVQVPVAPLDMPASPDNLMLKITSDGVFNGQPVPPMDYTFEFRQRSGWDANITTGALGSNMAPGAVAIHMIRGGDHPRIAWSAGNKAGWKTQGWIQGDSFVDLARSLAINVAWIPADFSTASVFIVAGVNATLPMISVRKSLAYKFDVSKGLRQIKPSPPFPGDSLRAILLDNPPQFAP